MVVVFPSAVHIQQCTVIHHTLDDHHFETNNTHQYHKQLAYTSMQSHTRTYSPTAVLHDATTTTPDIHLTSSTFVFGRTYLEIQLFNDGGTQAGAQWNEMEFVVAQCVYMRITCFVLAVFKALCIMVLAAQSDNLLVHFVRLSQHGRAERQHCQRSNVLVSALSTV